MSFQCLEFFKNPIKKMINFCLKLKSSEINKVKPDTYKNNDNTCDLHMSMGYLMCVLKTLYVECLYQYDLLNKFLDSWAERFFFCCFLENLRHQKDILKLTDLLKRFLEKMLIVPLENSTQMLWSTWIWTIWPRLMES